MESSTHEKEQTGRLEEPQVISTMDKVTRLAEVSNNFSQNSLFTSNCGELMRFDLYCEGSSQPGHHHEPLQTQEPGPEGQNASPREKKRPAARHPEGRSLSRFHLQEGARRRLHRGRHRRRPRGTRQGVFQVTIPGVLLGDESPLCLEEGGKKTNRFSSSRHRLALQELQRSLVFEGPPGRVFFTYDLTALEQRKYFEAGVLIGWSMAQGGPGPRFLHPELYQVGCYCLYCDDWDENCERFD